MPKKETQIQILEQARGERELSVIEFCAEIGISRQWYYLQRENQRDVLDLKALSFLAVDRAGTWVGDLAVRCIRLVDERFIPCVCLTAVGDKGDCPKHGVVEASPILEAV